MITSLAHRVECTIRQAIRFFLSPLFYIANAVLALLCRRSKTAAMILLKAQLIRDILLRSPPPSYHSTTRADQNAARLRALEVALQKRDLELASRSQAIEIQQRQLDAERNALESRAAELANKENSLDRTAEAQQHQNTELTSNRDQLTRDAATLQENQNEVQNLREMVARERSIVERQRSENSQTRQRLREEQEKNQADASARQKQLDERQSEINELHDRFLRSHLETMEHHRKEHSTLVQSLQSRLAESQEQHQKTEQVRTELEQRLSFLTNELADRTEREFNLGTELGELRQKLSNERGSFNREFGELSRSLSELKLRCSQYEKDLASEQKFREELKAKEQRLADLEKDVLHREQLLQVHAKSLETLEESLKAQETELVNRERNLQDREKSLDEKSKALDSLQLKIDERINDITAAEKDLAIRTKGHEDAVRLVEKQDTFPSSVDPAVELPDTQSDQQSANTVTPTRPSVRERLSRRTSVFVEKVAHRKSISSATNRQSQEQPPAPNRSTKSRDGIPADIKPISRSQTSV